MASLRYPNVEILHDNTDWLNIRSYRYDAGDILTSGPTKTQIDNFILPIPSNIQDGNSVSYADDKLNSIAEKAFGATKELMNLDLSDLSLKTIGNKSDSISNAFKSVGLNNAVDLIKKQLAAEAVSIFGGNVSLESILAREEGQILNPNMELLFNGVTLRTFRFSFKMTPRDDAEAKNVSLIIRRLKKNMSAYAGEGIFLKTPNVFELEYKKGSGTHPFLNKFKPCALTDMSVNYTGENVYATYEDGTPISILMDLTFKELTPVYQGDYKDEDESGNTITNVGF